MSISTCESVYGKKLTRFCKNYEQCFTGFEHKREGREWSIV